MHNKNYEVFFDEHYKSLIMQKDWYYKRYGLDTDITPPILALIAQVLPQICSKGYKEAQKIINNDNRFEIMCKVDEYGLSNDYKQILREYLRDSKKYCNKCRKIRFSNKINKFFYKHKWLRGCVIGFYYRFINKKPRLSNKEIKELKERVL